MFTFLFRACARATFIALVSTLAIAAYIATAWQLPTVFRSLKRGAEYTVDTVGYLTPIDPAFLNIASELGLATKLILIVYVIIIYIVLNGLWRSCTSTLSRAKHLARRSKNKETK